MSRALVTNALKGLVLAMAAAAAGVSPTNTAYAAFVFSPEPAFIDFSASGSGVSAPRPLTLQTGRFESRSAAPNRGHNDDAMPVRDSSRARTPGALDWMSGAANDLALQKGNGKAVFDFQPTATEASGLLAGSLGCAGDAPRDCAASNDDPGSLLGFARSAVAAPLPGAIFLFGSVLFGGLGMSARRSRRRNRGAVSLLD